MKKNIVIIVGLLFGTMAWGQDCDTKTDKDERIKCLEKKLEQELKNLEKERTNLALEKEKTKGLQDASEYYDPATYPIFIDFNYGKSEKHKTISLPEAIKKGDFYQIYVQRINLNKWRVNVNSRDTTDLSPLATPSFGDLQLDVISGLTSVLAETINISKPTVSENNTFASVQSTVTNETNYVKVVNDEISKVINSYNDDLLIFKNTQIGFVEKVDELKLAISYKQLALFDDTGQITSKFNVEKAVKEITQRRKEAFANQKGIVDKEKKYIAFSKDKAKQMAKNPTYKKADAAIKAGFTKLKSNIAKILETINAEKTTAMIKSIIYLKERTDDFVSLPIQFSGNQALVSIEFVPKDSLINENLQNVSFKFTSKRQNYWGIDGFFYGATLYDENFSSITTIDSEGVDEVRFVKEDVTKAEIGVATLIRYGKKYSKDHDGTFAGHHFVFGPGISITQKVRPRLLFGGGFSLGKKHSLSIDGGVIVGFVERKSNAFELNTTLNVVPESLTISKLDIGIFLGIGYMFKL